MFRSGYTYIPVEDSPSYFIDDSVDQAVPVLHQAILANAGQDIVVIGYSEGTLVAEEERRALAGSAIDPNKLKFTMIASPNVPNGGIYGRFPHLNLLILSSNGPAQPSQFDTTYYTNEYDPYADFPAYFNPLSLANSLVAVFYVHPDKYYDTITGSTTTTVVPNSAGGTDTYIFIDNADGALPLFQPVRDLSGALGIAFLTEPAPSGAEPVVRLIIDMGYTDRENLDPATPTRFRSDHPAREDHPDRCPDPGRDSAGREQLRQRCDVGDVVRTVHGDTWTHELVVVARRVRVAGGAAGTRRHEAERPCPSKTTRRRSRNPGRTRRRSRSTPATRSPSARWSTTAARPRRTTPRLDV